jgi:uncharacterized damage-inducible protein DinB
METNAFILDMLGHMKKALTGALDGLSHEEIKWQPNPEANSIGFILWHLVRAEDGGIQSFIQQKPQVWVAEKWYQKLNLSEYIEDNGWGYTAEQVAAFPVPELKGLLGYADAVRSRTIEYLQGVTPDKLDERVKTPFGELSAGQILSLFMVELAQHIGHIAYLRGLQRGINK